MLAHRCLNRLRGRSCCRPGGEDFQNVGEVGEARWHVDEARIVDQVRSADRSHVPVEGAALGRMAADHYGLAVGRGEHWVVAGPKTRIHSGGTSPSHS